MNISMETLTHGESNTTNPPAYTIPTSDCVMYAMNALFGLPTHFYIVWLIFTGVGKGIASELFILNVSVCEIVHCLRSLIASIANEFPVLWFVVLFLSGIAVTGHFFQCLICVERYLAVLHPVIFLKYNFLRYRVACSTVTWIMSFLSCVICLQFFNLSFGLHFEYFYLSHYSAFLAINLFCCLAVLRALKKPRPGERRREEQNRLKRRAFCFILITTLSLVMVYFSSIFLSLRHLLSLPAFPGLNSLSLTLYLLASFIQPLQFIRRVGKMPFCKTSAGT